MKIYGEVNVEGVGSVKLIDDGTIAIAEEYIKYVKQRIVIETVNIDEDVKAATQADKKIEHQYERKPIELEDIQEAEEEPKTESTEVAKVVTSNSQKGVIEAKQRIMNYVKKLKTFHVDSARNRVNTYDPDIVEKALVELIQEGKIYQLSNDQMGVRQA